MIEDLSGKNLFFQGINNISFHNITFAWVSILNPVHLLGHGRSFLSLTSFLLLAIRRSISKKSYRRLERRKIRKRN
jgi:hypothetical protein